jgi:ankyrin repeat protein
MNLTPPPQPDDPIITQFNPVEGQWKLNDKNIKRIDPRIGGTILHNYCEYINTTPLGVWRYLIEVKGCDINGQDKKKKIPLHDAILFFDPNEGGDVNILHYLLSQKGIDGNTKGQYGYTLLHYACENINALPIDIFELLIETLGCDVNAYDNYGDTPILHVFRQFSPIKGGDITVLMYLLNQKSIDVNVKGKRGGTLLHTACININTLLIDVFKLLIETMGCDVNAQNNDNDTPLHNALFSFDPNKGGDISVLQYLLRQKGINRNINDKYRYSLLHAACNNINALPLDVFKVLIETHGGDVNVQDKGNNTPLRFACCAFDPNKGGDIPVLTYLISQKDVNLNIKDQMGYNLLHLNCTNNFSVSVELNARYDTMLCQVVEFIVEKYTQQILDEVIS